MSAVQLFAITLPVQVISMFTPFVLESNLIRIERKTRKTCERVTMSMCF